jgi:hypothetical protein
MSIDRIFFYFGLLLVIISFFIRKEKKRARWLVTLAALTFIFVPFYLPKQVFGSWNLIKSFKGKQIGAVILKPSSPDWKVNLTDSDFMITNRSALDNLTKLLSKTQAYFPNHSSRIWETSLFLITTTKDTMKFKVSKTENNGTIVTTGDGEFTKDNLDEYLEHLTNFKEAAFAKYSKNKQDD